MGNKSTHKVYSDKRIITFVSVDVKKKWGYGFLTSIKVQEKLHHLKLEYEVDFINALLHYIKRVVIKTGVKIPKNGVVYLNKYTVKSLMRRDEIGWNNVNLEGREWTNNDIKRSKKMLEATDKTLKHIEQLKRHTLICKTLVTTPYGEIVRNLDSVGY
nr:hypothetical protein [Tanacetum cinerariifolium]